ncbi:MAG: hypothetical protein ING90_05205 [Rhodocyclaceae bacterium]|nr:hypothetical protein [Rhodocyclaceae bacterium]MCA3075789.1 hypothetical protein [Rhodocyclaceae bacterium]MCA3091572.1 hypothetical protein [Rhodocyclaceae bacterium]MCA3094094.1 hypothetical protein [Rhodocyclaceae bacterium]MCA3099115.1 hypothetical protein [Rhodocyclaceae bacterium]
MELETTVYETAWHWYRFVMDSFACEQRTIVTERRVFNVRCAAGGPARPAGSPSRAGRP